MIDKNSRIVRDAIRKAERTQVMWWNGESMGTFATLDEEFAKDIANAYARLCDRQEKSIFKNSKL